MVELPVKTSENSPIELVRVVPENEKGGWIAITLCPGKKVRGHECIWNRDLKEDLTRIKELGAGVLIPLIEDAELKTLGVEAYGEEVHKLHLNVLHFPFADHTAPVRDEGFENVIFWITDLYLKHGTRFVIHCAGGMGRAGLMAACLRLRLGLDKTADEAIAKVRELRSPRAIETKEQEEFIRAYAGPAKILKRKPKAAPKPPARKFGEKDPLTFKDGEEIFLKDLETLMAEGWLDDTRLVGGARIMHPDCHKDMRISLDMLGQKAEVAVYHHEFGIRVRLPENTIFYSYPRPKISSADFQLFLEKLIRGKIEEGQRHLGVVR